MKTIEEKILDKEIEITKTRLKIIEIEKEIIETKLRILALGGDIK
jgi:hypothetical protein